MAQYSGLSLTEKGRTLLAKALTGVPLHFSRVMSGDGFLPAGTEIYDLENLVSPKKELPISSVEVTGVGTARIRAIMTNQGQPEGFFIREIGLFANDPDEGEILYAYANAGDKPDYLPGQDGPDVVQTQLSLITVIDRAANVTATISTDLVFVTQEELQYRLDNLFGPAAEITHIWTRTHGDDKKLRPVPLEDAKLAILGGVDLPRTHRKVEHIEDAVAEILLELEVKETYPDYRRFILEDFRNLDVLQVDLSKCRVTAVVAGDSSLDVSGMDGIIPCSWYTLTDGVRHEQVCVKSMNTENGVNRLILAAPVQNTYMLENCRLYRSSATIRNDMASGPVGKQTLRWNPGIVWSGLAADTPTTLTLATNIGQAGDYDTTDRIAFTADGLVTLA